MSHSESKSDSPALGDRTNWWGDDDAEVQTAGHQETDGTNPAEHIAFQQLLKLVNPVCWTQLNTTPDRGYGPFFEFLETGSVAQWSDPDALHTETGAVELSEPELYVPKSHDTCGKPINYRQERHQRRYNPETGYINWGETTSTALPEINENLFFQAVGGYLMERYSRSDGGGLTLTKIDDYVEYAHQIWHDPTQNSHGSLTKVIEYVREHEQD